MFGDRLAVTGDVIAVGATQENGGRGAVYVFSRKHNGEWDGGAKLSVADQNSQLLSSSLAVDGGTLVAGTSSGFVYYQNVGDGVWNHKAHFGTGKDYNLPRSSIGYSLAVQEDEFLVAGEFSSTDEAIHVWRWDQLTSGWGNPDTLSHRIPNATVPNFGYKLQSAPGTILASSTSTTYGGHVFNYDGETKAWTVSHVILPEAARGTSDGVAGRSISMDGGRIAIGFPNLQMVAVYEYSAASSAWEPVATIRSPKRVLYKDGFGESVALDGGRLFIGAPRSPSADNGADVVLGTGRVFLFLYDSVSKTWKEDMSFEFPSPEIPYYADAGFGSVIGAKGSNFAVGLPTHDGTKGIAFAYQMDTPNPTSAPTERPTRQPTKFPTPERVPTTPSPTPAPNVIANSGGAAATLAAQAVTLVAAATMALVY